MAGFFTLRAVNPADLVRALQASAALRDKIVVLSLPPPGEPSAEAPGGDRAAAFAEPIALLRSSGAKVLVICDPGAGPGLLDALRPALDLAGALIARGTQALALSASSVLSVHLLPPEAAAALRERPDCPSWEGEGIMPIVNPVAVLHLQTLGYVPILVTPVADQAGAAAPVSGDTLAAILAHALTAAAILPSSRLADPGRILLDVLLPEPSPASAS